MEPEEVYELLHMHSEPVGCLDNSLTPFCGWPTMPIKNKQQDQRELEETGEFIEKRSNLWIRTSLRMTIAEGQLALHKQDTTKKYAFKLVIAVGI